MSGGGRVKKIGGREVGKGGGGVVRYKGSKRVLREKESVKKNGGRHVD